MKSNKKKTRIWQQHESCVVRRMTRTQHMTKRKHETNFKYTGVSLLPSFIVFAFINRMLQSAQSFAYLRDNKEFAEHMSLAYTVGSL